MSLLGIDVGTTGCKVMAISIEGKVLATGQREYDVVRPRTGWAELDSRAVWGKVEEAIQEVTAQIQDDPVVALSMSSMGEALTPVSHDREILGNCLLGFDIRGIETLEKLAELDTIEFFERSGNLPSGVYGGDKMIWQRDNTPELFEKTDKFLFWSDVVAFMLGGEATTDYSMANRTLFFDLRAETWSQETLDYVGMPREKLPNVVQAGTVVGTVAKEVGEKLGLSPDVKIVIGAHDQSMSATGAGVIKPGMATYALGTYTCITPTYGTIPPAEQMIKTRLSVEHHALPGLYVSFYYNLTGGALLKWFRNTFAPLEHAAAQANGTDVYDLLLAEMPTEPTNLIVLPHFAPTGPPYYDENPYGLIAGLTLETSRGEYIKGLLEGVTYYFRDGERRMAEAGIAIDEYHVTGGGAKSDTWLQIKADILGRPLIRPQITEASALGAAILAGIGGGVYASIDEAIATLVKTDRVFEPDPARHAIYDERFAKYHLLYPFCQSLRD